MDLFDLLLQTGLVTTALVAYLIFFKRSTPILLKGNYREPGWNYYFRVLVARYAVKRWKKKQAVISPLETPRVGQNEGWDCVSIRATAPDGSAVYVGIRKLCERPTLSEATVHVKLPDGTTYRLPQHPDTLIGPWERVDRAWKAGNLEIEVLEHERRLRITFNGLLKRESDDVIQHARFNFIWASASHPHRYPEDWSVELSAQALALEPWRDGDWPSILGHRGDGSWLQWGAVQGRFESYDSERVVDKTAFLRLRGVKERSWSPKGYQGLRRAVTITAAAGDGTAVMLRGFSYRDVLTVGYTGCVRFPDTTVHSITGTDLMMENFGEHPEGIPSAFTINVSTKNRSFTIVLHLHSDVGTLLSGTPYQHQVVYRTAAADIDGYSGSAIVELGYHTDKPGPKPIQPGLTLRWAKESEVGSVSYCADFESTAARCPAVVGGKGASLALLASAQEQLGYKVPPGYCLTTKGLEKYLQVNTEISAAIREIEAANENYEESNFKEKCNRVVALFSKTEIEGEIREEILSHLAELRKKAIEQNLGPEVRFAVRSSGVGEDSEALSAAGQNETVLGCGSDSDVLQAVRRCWGSMFAFTSVYYRRQNGQACLCDGAVVVQALVRARAAGVLFTRHPAAGDPARLLITANYGLGETVVSGSVEPDTIIVSRKDKLAIAKIELGSKKHRVTAAGDSVTTEEVSVEERRLPCLAPSEIMKLAAIGVAHEQAWGAGRDIEWAVAKDDIYLLQARPITSLQQWTEEELRHELDTAVMADDELLTFANTGEVLPRPLTALSYDLMFSLLVSGLDSLHSREPCCYDSGLTVTHLRVCIALYNNVYRIPPAKLDLMAQLMELSLSGNKIADENTITVAKHRRDVTWWLWLQQLFLVPRFILLSKSAMNSAVKIAKSLELNFSEEDPMTLLEAVADRGPLLYQNAQNHGLTSAASSVSQMIAMAVLAEGANEFTIEKCNEINTLLNSGGVLSAEVPQLLAKMTRKLQESGKFEQFKALDPKEALNWLSINLPDIYNDVGQFLEQHGHRAVMEFDYITKPWSLEPHRMMEVLQSMQVSSEEEKPSQKSDNEIIASLTTPKKPLTRTILRWILPLCRRTVRHRENTKSHLCLTIHKLRVALYRVGKLMVKQWYIPDEELVFHFRLHELREFLVTRDPALLRKASQRRQYYPSWCKLKFAEVNHGWVTPLRSRAPALAAGDVTVSGTVVCGGETVARACVVQDFSEVSQLQQGDILITHATDIGWSPYFPLLSGIVTELGGLISHGAVIAREYGLPCIVGATDATLMFKTGDMVRLSATKGVLEKVLLAEKDNTDDDKQL